MEKLFKLKLLSLLDWLDNCAHKNTKFAHTCFWWISHNLVTPKFHKRIKIRLWNFYKIHATPEMTATGATSKENSILGWLLHFVIKLLSSCGRSDLTIQVETSMMITEKCLWKVYITTHEFFLIWGNLPFFVPGFRFQKICNIESLSVIGHDLNITLK